VGSAITTSRIDSLESNENAKCPLTVEIQLQRWAGIFGYSAENWTATK
jgi:metal-dependent HD superfamily phosphatase/phosphodiesterase